MRNPSSILTKVSGRLFFAVMLMAAASVAYGQDCEGSVSAKSDSIWVQSLKEKLSLFIIPTPDSSLLKSKGIDTARVTGKLKQIKENYLSYFKKDSSGEKKAPLIYFQQGYIQYNMNYRSRIDTPFAETGIIQHLGMATGNFVIAGKLPVTVSYIERQSNSSLFRDFRDIRADINGPELQRYQAEQLRQRLVQQVTSLKDSTTLPAIRFQEMDKFNLDGLLRNPRIMELLIESKERIIHINEEPGSCRWKDSVLRYSKQFVGLYEEREQQLNAVNGKLDSLKTTYNNIQRKIQLITGLINRRFNTKEGVEEIYKVMKREGITVNGFGKFGGFLYSLRHLSLGRTIPDFSPLTVKNINVKGINAEFGNDWWYAAVTAGVVDFRIRDFVSGKQNQSPQSVYAVKAGIGSKEKTHLFFTGYKGRKQIYYMNSPSSEIAGAAAELQYAYNNNHIIKAEAAQSTVPLTDTSGKETTFKLKDKTGRAYHIEGRSYFPHTKSTIEGFYQNTGINFQSFNSYRVNAAAESWSLRYEQYLFNRLLRINAGMRKNDFTNPLISQNYSSNTVFKTLQATFKKRNWPSVSAGYIPSSQYVVIDSQVYESRYQTFTVNVNHYYKVGTARALTNTFYSRFYNSGSDSSFVYYNANYVSLYQQFQFLLNTSVLGITVTKNSQFTLNVYQVGAGTTLLRSFTVEGGAKINHLNKIITKAGLYAKMRTSLSWLGELSGWYEDGYLPGTGKSLVRNEQFNIGFTRRIK